MGNRSGLGLLAAVLWCFDARAVVIVCPSKVTTFIDRLTCYCMYLFHSITSLCSVFRIVVLYMIFFFFCLRIILTLQIQSYYTRNAKCPYVLRLDWNGTIRCKKKIYMINTSTTFTNFRNAMIHSLRLEVILKPIMTSDAVWKIHCTLYTGMSFVFFLWYQRQINKKIIILISTPPPLPSLSCNHLSWPKILFSQPYLLVPFHRLPATLQRKRCGKSDGGGAPP